MSETRREYAANYRKPPEHTRFKRGQSGNPRGRPAKTYRRCSPQHSTRR